MKSCDALRRRLCFIRGGQGLSRRLCFRLDRPQRLDRTRNAGPERLFLVAQGTAAAHFFCRVLAFAFGVGAAFAVGAITGLGAGSGTSCAVAPSGTVGSSMLPVAKLNGL